VAQRSPAPPSPQARRQAQLQALQAALAARDPFQLERLLGQWVHRHGVNAVAALSAELAEADPEGWIWWEAQTALPHQPVEQKPPVRMEPQLPRATRPAPAPSHPALVQLRSWLPDQESRRAA
jgi:hypothetical protein